MTNDTSKPTFIVLADAASQQIKSFIDRLERLHDEKDEVSGQITEVFDEAKSQGFDPKILREVLKIRKEDKDKRQEHEALLEMYLNAVGM